MEHKKNIKLVFIITTSLILGVIAGIIIHEFGHGLAGAAAGGGAAGAAAAGAGGAAGAAG